MSPKSHKILLASPLETICVQHFGIKFCKICVPKLCALRHITMFDMNNKMNLAFRSEKERMNVERASKFVKVRRKSIFFLSKYAVFTTFPSNSLFI